MAVPREWMHDAAAQMLRVVIDSGPRNRRVLVSLHVAAGLEAFAMLLDQGVLVAIGKKRGTKYGTPEQARRLAARR